VGGFNDPEIYYLEQQFDANVDYYGIESPDKKDFFLLDLNKSCNQLTPNTICVFVLMYLSTYGM
jgi:hypothetical protein